MPPRRYSSALLHRAASCRPAGAASCCALNSSFSPSRLLTCAGASTPSRSTSPTIFTPTGATGLPSPSAIAPLPAQIIDKGQPGPGLLTQVVINKYQHHLPLTRQQCIFAREGVDIPRSTLSSWVGAVGVALTPLAEALHQELLTRDVLHADETPLTVLNAKTKKAERHYLWTYVSGESTGPAVVLFDCCPGRGKQYPQHILDGWQGHLMVDGYAGYHALFDGENPATELGCWAHARRRFHDVYSVTKNKQAAAAIMTIRKLYRCERRMKQAAPHQQIKYRRRYAGPVLREFRRWLDETLPRTPPGSGLHKAISYTLKRWPALTRYTQDIRLPVDNNRAENVIRPVAVGRKNWLFAGSPAASQRAATIMSLLATARLNGIDPHQWLYSVLTRLPEWPNARLRELLPYPENHFD
ncbi:IS66 family transposase [Salmonella enterica]|nr:IS66 family transposase [Salmonella enterica]ECI4153506.1 IS66 family transposase [Salmonella enterica subsp. salamae]EAU0241992.1 IS66 family transposase [Salmonella enterica]EAX3604319.1 IS66 family transposase [Salmonella enterica]EAY8297363.1 IS66 family transposase [Salmonella enterica]